MVQLFFGAIFFKSTTLGKDEHSTNWQIKTLDLLISG